jgi:hypothetical protein
MKNRVIASIALGSALLGGTAMIASTAMAQTPGTSPAPTAPAPTAPAPNNGGFGGRLGLRAQKNEKHPELRKALRALTNAQKFMQSAASDFGGHKEKALDATQHAIDEVKAALAYDRH